MRRLNESRVGAVFTASAVARLAARVSSSPHARPGVSLLLGLDAPVVVTGGARSILAPVVVVPAHVVHAVTCPGPSLHVVFDPERAPAVTAVARGRRAPFAVQGADGGALRAAFASHRAALCEPAVLVGLVRELTERVGREGRPAPLDRRVARLAELARAEGVPGAPRARAVSPHVADLFARQVGIPLRTYRLWRRLLRALSALSRCDVTGAAHEAGFADTAHLSRTCRRMTGHSPTGLVETLVVGEVPAPAETRPAP
jgi:hypothetical protein